jgi:hypothetical protein
MGGTTSESGAGSVLTITNPGGPKISGSGTRIMENKKIAGCEVWI